MSAEVLESLAAWELSLPVCVTGSLVRLICLRHDLDYNQVRACLDGLNREAKRREEKERQPR